MIFAGVSDMERYTLFLSDECIAAPMAFFNTDLLELSRKANFCQIKTMGVNQGDPEDPHDQNYLNETSRKYTRVRKLIRS